MDISVGTRFGRLTVLADDGPLRVQCACECGETRIVARNNLRKGRQVSCGCRRREITRARCDKSVAERENRFWARVDRRNGSNGCWPWTGPLCPQGYGRTPSGLGHSQAHLTAYELMIGPIPTGLHLDHACHTFSVCQLGPACPHRACCNPAHLEPVTPKVNGQRAAYKKTHCDAGHELPQPAPNGRRVCRLCANTRNRRYKAKIRARDVYLAVMKETVA